MPALPAAPVRVTSFTDRSTAYPTTPQPGNLLDAEFDRTNAAVAALISFVSTLFQTDGSLKPHTVPATALTADITAQLTTLNTAAAVVTQQGALKWAEYLAGPVIAPADAPAAIAASNVPSGLFYDPVAGGPGGLFSAKYWALQAQTAVNAFKGTYGAPAPPPSIQIVPLTPWTFTNSGTSFPLTRRDTGEAISPNQNALLVSLNGFLQTPGVDFTVAGSTITFAQAPLANEPHYAAWLSPQASTSPATNDIRLFGGRGDGVTDNTAAFNAALLVGDVYIPPGIFYFASAPNPITVARSVFGAGRTATNLVIGFAAGDFLRIGDGAGSTPSFVTIQGARITCSVTRVSGAAVRVFPAHHAVVRDIAIQPGVAAGGVLLWHYNGIQIDGGTNQYICRVEDFEIGQCQGFAIGLRSLPQDVSIQDGTIGNCAGAGLDLSSGSGIYVSDVSIIVCLFGILCAPSAGDHVEALFCTNVLGDTSVSDNWQFAGTGNITDVHLTNCWASAGSSAHGFSIDNPNLNGFSLVNSHSHGNALDGVFINRGKNISIVGNQIGMNSLSADLAGADVHLWADTSDVVISDNLIGQVGFYALYGVAHHVAAGISIEPGAGDRLVITGNKIDGGLFAPGICKATGNNIIIKDNVGWRTAFSGFQKVAAGQSSVTFPHGLVVDANKIVVSVTSLVNYALAGVGFCWAESPSVGIGGTVTVHTNVAAANDFWFAFRCTAFD